MNLKIGIYTIKTDPHNFILYKEYEKDKGGTGSKVVGYYGNIGQAVKAIVKEELHHSDAESVRQLQEILLEHEQKMEDLINELRRNV